MNTKLTTAELLKKIAGVLLLLIGGLCAFSLFKQIFDPPYSSFDQPPAGYYGFLLVMIFICFKYGFRLYEVKKNDDTKTISFECIHCNYKSETDFTYCPKCKKNDNGLIIEENNQNNI